MKVIILALAFMCVFESLMPLLLPETWQKALREMAAADPDMVRQVAAVVLAAGLAVIWLL